MLVPAAAQPTASKHCREMHHNLLLHLRHLCKSIENCSCMGKQRYSFFVRYSSYSAAGVLDSDLNNLISAVSVRNTIFFNLKPMIHGLQIASDSGARQPAPILGTRFIPYFIPQSCGFRCSVKHCRSNWYCNTVTSCSYVTIVNVYVHSPLKQN